MNKKKIIVLLITIFSVTLLADLEFRPTPYIISLNNGQNYFKIIDDSLFNLNNNYFSNGYMYQVETDSCDLLLWMTKQHIGYRVFFVEEDINYFVTLGDWPSDNEPQDYHMAIAFYHQGNQIKSYSTKNLIEDKSKIKQSISHYEFLKRVIGFTKRYNFSIETIDGMIYEFDVKTGKITSKDKPWW